MKKLIVIALSLLLVIGTGAGAWFFVLQRDAEAAEVVRPPDPVFVTFNPLQLPVIGDGRIEQLVNISLALEVADQETADRVIAMAPRLNDAYIQTLYGALHSKDVLVDGTVDVTMIKRRLLEVSARIMGQGAVKDALVQMLTQRRL